MSNNLSSKPGLSTQILHRLRKLFNRVMVLRLYLLTILIITTPAPIIFVYSSNTTCFIGSEKIYLLAVSQDPVSGKYIGVATEAIVSLSRGEGAVYISVEPMSQIDMQASLNVAYLIASHVSKANISEFNVYVRVVSDTPIIGGPSASGFLTVAIASLLLNQSLRRDIVMTGMIMPDGIIGPVGGIPEKLLAAKSVNAHVMLIPTGQRYSTDLNTGQKVDVVAKGAELGIKVIEVANIYDALRNLGINITEPEPTTPVINLDINEIYRDWALKLNATLNNLWNEIKDLSSKISLTSNLRNAVAYYANLADNSSRRGYEEYLDNNMYSSASDYFTAVIYADYVKWIYLIYTNVSKYRDLYNTVNEQYRYAYNKYRDILNTILSTDYIDLSKLAVLNEVSYRIYEANTTLSNLPSPGSRTLTLDDIYNAVYTYWRINSSLEWMKIYEIYPPSNMIISLSTLKRYSYTLISYVQTLLIYLNSLGVVLDTSTANRVSNLINLATTLYREGDYVASNSLAIYLTSLTTAYMNIYFTTNLTETISSIRDLALRYLGELKTKGIDISIPSAYIIRGDTLKSLDPASAIYFYELSIANTMWLVTLASLKTPQQISTQIQQIKTIQPSLETSIGVESTTPMTFSNKYMLMINIMIISTIIIIVALIVIYILERKRRK